MANTIKVKRSATPSAVPTTGQLDLGEIAVNTYDGKLYIKKDNGTASIVEVGASGGGGLTSLNSQTGATQTFAVGTSGTNFAVSSASNVHTFNLPDASATNRGALTSANWTTFNNKLGSLNSQTGATQTFAVGTSGTDFAVSSSTDTHTFNLPDASATARGVVTTGTQTLAGQKNLTGQIGINEASPGSQLQITSGAAARKGLIVKGAASQTATLFEAQNSAGTAVVYFTNAGAASFSSNITTTGSLSFGPTGILSLTSNGNYNGVALGRSSSTGESGLVLGSYLSAGSNEMRMGWGGGGTGRVIYGLSTGEVGIGVSSPGAQLHAQSKSASMKGMIVQGAASQSANLIEVQNSSGTVLSSFNSSGQIGVGATATCPLDIYGTSVNAKVNQFSADTTGATLTFQKSRAATVSTNTIVQSDDQIGVITFNGANGSTYSNAAQIRAVIDATPGASADMPGRLEFLTSADGSATVTERMRIDSSGKIGIGASPNTKLDVADAFQDFTGLSPGSKSVALFRTTDTATANYGGNILLGGNYTGTSYYPHAGIKGALTASGSFGGYLALYTTEDTSGFVRERMRIDKVGNVGIGVTNPTYQLQLSTDSAAKLTTTTWSTTSDARVKKNVEPYEKGLTEICQLRPITYDFNGLGGMAEGPGGISVIAQEIQPIFPECVGTYKAKLHPTDSEETDILNFNGHAILFALINSVKELRVKLDTLEQRLTLLETSS